MRFFMSRVAISSGAARRSLLQRLRPVIIREGGNRSSNSSSRFVLRAALSSASEIETPHVRVADPRSLRQLRNAIASSSSSTAVSASGGDTSALAELIRAAGTTMSASSAERGNEYEAAAAAELFCDACRHDPAGSARVWVERYPAETLDRALRNIMRCDADGLSILVEQRGHLLRLKGEKRNDGSMASLEKSDAALKSMLGVLFSPSLLTVERVDLTSPGTLLEKIIRYEKVRPYSTLDHFKRRLGPGRRCFALFHPSIPGEPLAFVHCALLKTIAPDLKYIQDNTGNSWNASQANAAVFYSISSTQPGLQGSGVDLGAVLLKRAVSFLSSEFRDTLDTFSTLSPMPRFVPWVNQVLASSELSALHSVDKDAAENIKAFLSDSNGKGNLAKPHIMRLAAAYLLNEKNGRGGILCPVGNFHVRNGARIGRINWMGDPSKLGRTQSGCVMVNYHYPLDHLEENRRSYGEDGIVAVTKDVQKLLTIDGI